MDVIAAFICNMYWDLAGVQYLLCTCNVCIFSSSKLISTCMPFVLDAVLVLVQGSKVEISSLEKPASLCCFSEGLKIALSS